MTILRTSRLLTPKPSRLTPYVVRLTSYVSTSTTIHDSRLTPTTSPFTSIVRRFAKNHSLIYTLMRSLYIQRRNILFYWGIIAISGVVVAVMSCR